MCVRHCTTDSPESGFGRCDHDRTPAPSFQIVNQRTGFSDREFFHLVNSVAITDDRVRIESLAFADGKDGTDLTLRRPRHLDSSRARCR
jgi:hypothetical protein